jgi:hypothetical protein
MQKGGPAYEPAIDRSESNVSHPDIDPFCGTCSSENGGPKDTCLGLGSYQDRLPPQIGFVLPK